MKHFTTAKKISKNTLFEIFDLAKTLEVAAPEIRFMQPLKGFVLANLFYEPSTRTSSSFYSAMTRQGGSCIPINEVKYSSVMKGENLEDTIRTMGGYADAIVLRSLNAGDAEIAASVSTVPIINAGDGSGEHPTQTLLDLYTIWQKYGRLENDLTITMMGDLANGRTIHSLLDVFEMFNVKIQLVSPDCLAEPFKYGAGVNIFSSAVLTKFIANQTDVLYMTRVQEERGSRLIYELTKEDVSNLKEDMIVMHPFPRNQEIPRWFDNDKRAMYFKQMENGLFIRMALLQKILLNC